MSDQRHWHESAEAWIEFVDRGDMNRELLLDPVILDICGEVQGLDVCDIGCGEGRFCRRLAKRGALVVGLDPIDALIEVAHERGGGQYVKAMAERLPIQDTCFDIVISYLALLDIEGYVAAIREMARVLKPGGRAIVANQNAFITTNMTGWHKSPTGEKLHFPVDHYLEERGMLAQWAGIEIINYHRPLSSYFEAFLSSGFQLKKFLEPGPSEELLRSDPKFEEWQRVPFFYVAEWIKAGA